MAGRFQFESPGAAFVDQMAKTLAQRKIEERQAMLDNLAKNADTRAAEEAKQMAIQRADQLKTMQQQREISRLGALTEGMAGGTSVEGMNPDDLALLERYRRVREVEPEPIPSVSTDETFNEVGEKGEKGAALESDQPLVPVAAAPIIAPRPKRKVFAGTVEEQKKAERIAKGRAALGVLATSGDPEDLKNAEYFSLLAELNDGDIPKEAYSILTPKQRAKIMNAETGAIREAVDDKGQPVMTRGDTILSHNPYHPPAFHVQKMGTSPEGTLLVSTPGGGVKDTGLKVGADPGELPFKIPVGLANAHRDSFVGLLAEGATAADVATFRKDAMDMLGAAQGVSPKVKMLIRVALHDPDALEAAYRANPLTQTEATDLAALLTTIIPSAAKDVLKQHVPKKTPVAPIVKPQSSVSPANPAGNAAIDRVTMRNWRPAAPVVTPQFDMSKDAAMKQAMQDAIFGKN